MQSFSKRLSELRKSKKVTQKELADLLQVAVRTVQYYESEEKRPDYEGLVKLADFFDVTIDYLVGRSDDPIRPEAASGEVPAEQAEFLKWIEENLEATAALKRTRRR